jgi:hypothetical protein
MRAPHKGLMKPLESCPYCNCLVRWILHDGLNSYDCRHKSCPIKFTERVWFPANISNPQLKDGVLAYYSFDVGKYHIVMDYSGPHKDPRMIINPSYTLGNPAADEIKPLDVVEIDWSDLSKLEDKIKTWVTFS